MKSPMLDRIEKENRRAYIKKTAIECTILTVAIAINVIAAIY